MRKGYEYGEIVPFDRPQDKPFQTENIRYFLPGRRNMYLFSLLLSLHFMGKNIVLDFL